MSKVKNSECKITEDMISEATIVKQLPKNIIDLTVLRQHGYNRRKEVHKGRKLCFCMSQ